MLIPSFIHAPVWDTSHEMALGFAGHEPDGSLFKEGENANT